MQTSVHSVLTSLTLPLWSALPPHSFFTLHFFCSFVFHFCCNKTDQVFFFFWICFFSHLEHCRTKLRSTCQWLKSLSSELFVQCTLWKPCPNKCGEKPGICILHNQRGCGHFDCGHYISLRSTTKDCEFFTHDAPFFCQEKLDPWTQVSEPKLG